MRLRDPIPDMRTLLLNAFESGVIEHFQFAFLTFCLRAESSSPKTASLSRLETAVGLSTPC